ncbi:MAG: NADH-quinone oxidoreductase subunit J [Deltaproteobacteria bacterium]|nr:NADH-quinone oxidoreductase subunit J [Deltaproteobacteria bacterium]
METILFYVLAAVTLLSAIFVVFLRRPVHNVLFMILTMIGLATLFILLQAEFLAMVQIIVYAGAVMVLFLFVIMLLNLEEVSLPKEPRPLRWGFGIILSLALVVILFPVFGRFVPSIVGTGQPEGIVGNVSNMELIAKELFTTYLLPFEVASVLLLVAIIGTVVIGRKFTKD